MLLQTRVLGRHFSQTEGIWNEAVTSKKPRTVFVASNKIGALERKLEFLKTYIHPCELGDSPNCFSDETSADNNARGCGRLCDEICQHWGYLPHAVSRSSSYDQHRIRIKQADMGPMKDLLKDLFEMQDGRMDFRETVQKVHGYNFECHIETNL